jgi:hypothetical protein
MRDRGNHSRSRSRSPGGTSKSANMSARSHPSTASIIHAHSRPTGGGGERTEKSGRKQGEAERTRPRLPTHLIPEGENHRLNSLWRKHLAAYCLANWREKKKSFLQPNASHPVWYVIQADDVHTLRFMCEYELMVSPSALGRCPVSGGGCSLAGPTRLHTYFPTHINPFTQAPG